MLIEKACQYFSFGLVLVSTEVWKLEKPSVVGHYVKSSN